MNLFLVGWSERGGADSAPAPEALRALLTRLPFFDPERIGCWQAPSGHVTLAYVGHDAERVGGVRYVDLDDQGMALFSGRPFRWTGEAEADGRSPLDPGFYRRPPGKWMSELDGRFAAARYDEQARELEVWADPLGAYPVYSGEANGTRWLSNSAELVRTALRTDELDLAVVASVLGAGHGLSGDPVWAKVRRLPRGGVARLRAGRPEARSELLPIDRIAAQTGGGLEPGRAARDLVAATAALADWPGRPILLQLSGGLDSRLVLAAALEAGLDVDVISTGTSATPDVRVARQLCAQVGLPHRLLPRDPGGALHRRAQETARIVGLASSGAISIEYAAGYPVAQSAGPLPLWLGGQGGEIARAYYGRTEGTGREALVQELFGRVGDSVELLSAAGRELLLREVAGTVDRQIDAGVALDDVPDLFYLFNRMGTWSATGFGCVEYAKGDSITPLWCSGLLGHQLAPAPAERADELFHAATLEELSPPLARAPFAEAWDPGSDEFGPVFEHVHTAVNAQPSHPAWEVTDRAYVDRLLAREPGSLDRSERRNVWRLASVFLNGGQEGR